MSYLDKTHSIADGQPVNLYQFVRGNNEKIWRFCDADQDLEINGEKWLAVAMSDERSAAGEGKVTIKMPSNNPVARLYRGIPPSQTVTLTIMRLNWMDSEIRIVWIGTIIEAKRPEIQTTQLISAGLSETMESAGLRLTWGRNCPYTLYDTDCKVKLGNFAVAGLSITAMDGVSITVDLPQNLPQGWFNAGFIEWLDDGVVETRAVTVHEHNKLTLMGGTQKLSIGTVIKVYPGCDGRAQTCLKKFNNMLNFGGIPHMPTKSPYDGSRVF
ncbi:phage tail protein [[Haemophilus] ducreyi]|uniref:phage BR0599 family protein n=1 Tax=Haemophilus ducreyi TaxID=730 RepID=UPI0006559F3F|nr:phage BR0599 family protein [[Haemophilus] ducreyi]AKO36076.1 phage tail protein [[Haemophilus] ducreyi]AKO37532.1 phage tail protein [[Haemophilus] ducreyi]AKO40578.1 phage tail protein [[Haemophilus] ducreyi]AKO42029.1 phage tail protein [[Haemophilus] ducreyi]